MEEVGSQLKSELARACLPEPQRLVYRRLAWINSICMLFLIVGVVGAQSRMPGRRAVPPLEQPAPVIVEPLPPVVPASAPTQADQPNEIKPETQPAVAVTLDTPEIKFAVPTKGTLVVPLSVAPTPVDTIVNQAAPVARPSEPQTIQSTGRGGERPAPYPYPPIAEQLGHQGTVMLLIRVDDAGKVVSAEIHQSSGSAILDDNAQSWVKNHWIVPPVNGGHVFLAPIHYQLSNS
jgi:protein TonB